MKAIRRLLPAVMLMLMCLMSCATDDDIVTGREVGLTVGVAHPSVNADSRIGYDEQGGDLICTWQSGDRLIVYDAAGNGVGELSVAASDAGKSFARFTGKLHGVAEGMNRLVFQYVPADAPADNSLSYDYSRQDGSKESMSRRDILVSSADVKVTGDEGYVDDIALERRSAFARFNLVYPTGVDVTAAEVVISGQGVKNGCELSVSDLSTMNSTDGPITVTAPTGDFFVSLIPSEAFAPEFTATVGDKTYRGSLSAVAVRASDYLREQQEQGITVEMAEVAEEPSTFVTIDGTVWAPYTCRSWIDCAKDDAAVRPFTYIPGVPFDQQGLSLSHVPADFYRAENNAVAYHYQWGRDFGFVASSSAYDQETVALPNSGNLPSGAATQYGFSSSTLPVSTPQWYTFAYKANTNSWCTSALTSWDGNNLPKGWRLPTKAEFEKLRPINSEIYFNYDNSSGYTIGSEKIIPFQVRPLDDGTSLIWSVGIESGIRHLDIRQVKGSYSAAVEITGEILSQCKKPLKFFAEGFRKNKGVEESETTCCFWTSDSETSGKAYRFKVKISGDPYVEINLSEDYQRTAASLLLVKE